MPTPSEIESIKIELTITEFEKQKLDKAATEELIFPEQIVLSQRDWEITTFTLENPPEAKQELKIAVANYQEKYGGNRL